MMGFLFFVDGVFFFFLKLNLEQTTPPKKKTQGHLHHGLVAAWGRRAGTANHIEEPDQV